MKEKIARYKTYNRNRKITAINFNKVKASMIFRVIPFLLHSNYPDLPGHVNDPKCPYGIHHLDPRKLMDIELFQRYFPKSSALSTYTASPFPERPSIYSLKTIGSIGTIAQTEKSDCDFWVSVNIKELGDEGVRLLREKCQGIEEWVLSMGVEVYFFLMDIDNTRTNTFDAKTDEESAGSALKLLLKDELFRTHILVAGKMLLWWLIPMGLTELEYQGYVRDLAHTGKINPHDFIDLGYISDIPKSEIFGACLWQMNKALDSPYKSVIKFAYLERLLKDSAQSLPLFSDKVKNMVTFPENLRGTPEENLELAQIDPYLLLAREIVTFYLQYENDPKQRDSLIRECLFLKTLEGMKSQKAKSERHKNLEKTIILMKRWRLLPNDFKHFSNFKSWKYKELIDFGSRVHEFLIETYKSLRWTFKSLNADNAVAITERDISVLGRKLFTFYDKKTDKIDYIKSISREAMEQKDITFHTSKFEKTFYYYVFQGVQDNQSIKDKTDYIIKRDDNLLRLITWLMVNGILSKRTRLHRTKNILSVSVADIKPLTDMMLEKFPRIKFAHVSSEQLLRQETITQALVVINMDKKPVRGAKTLDSTIISVNSYGEYFIHDYTTAVQLKNALRYLLTKYYVSRWNNNLDYFIPEYKEKNVIKSMLEI